mgnify:CR=1
MLDRIDGNSNARSSITYPIRELIN